MAKQIEGEAQEAATVNCFVVTVKGEVLVPIKSNSGADIVAAYEQANKVRKAITDVLEEAGASGLVVADPKQQRRKRDVVNGGPAAGSGDIGGDGSDG